MFQTVLVTGGTGYIGSWVVKQLLEKGYTVRVTVRHKHKKASYAHLEKLATGNPGRLEIHEANLLVNGSYDTVAKGADAILHMASPFTLRFEDPIKDLIEPAVSGTKNVLGAANRSGTVRRIVMTSSVVAIFGDNGDMKDKQLAAFSEKDFNETSSASHQPYSYSKLLAEKAAWEIHGLQKNWSMVTINPGFVMGPAISPSSDSESLAFMKNILFGKFRTGVPHLEFGLVDVRDVARAHILALENEQATGRFIINESSASIIELVFIIKKHFPKEFSLPLIQAPKVIIYLIGWAFGLTRKYISRNVGYHLAFDNTKSMLVLGMTYTPLETYLVDMVQQMKTDRPA
ncbi:SDR family oxidoreductase [Flavihumibacter fluvii]|uniref:SDR family oxidoreductase n=1 Tax=Flavihumibacter fluvii TaxID=2838157 RepID=UPI001BDE6A5B|nr:aldehyde reductase [Flavihumibacter fluvii]ULQ53615.1 aldehyde reductase [Flavihumibacter fluvii]